MVGGCDGGLIHDLGMFSWEDGQRGRIGCSRVLFLDPLAILSVWSTLVLSSSLGFMAWISWRVLFEMVRLFIRKGPERWNYKVWSFDAESWCTFCLGGLYKW